MALFSSPVVLNIGLGLVAGASCPRLIFLKYCIYRSDTYPRLRIGIPSPGVVLYLLHGLWLLSLR